MDGRLRCCLEALRDIRHDDERMVLEGLEKHVGSSHLQLSRFIWQQIDELIDFHVGKHDF